MQLINPEFRIETTSLCNAKCIICPRDTMTRPKTTMTNELFYDLVLQAQHLGADTISLFGFGEPLLDLRIAERIAFCSDFGFETFITTNASLLDVDVAQGLLDAGLSHIRFSVHGLDPDSYEAVHKGLNYNKAIRNIQNFIARNRIQNNGNCKVSISVIPMHNEMIENIRERWEKYVDYLEVWRPHNWGPANNYRLITKLKKKSCGRPQRGPLQIQSDGTVIPCCFLTNSELVLGNAYKKSIEDILKDEPYQALRLAHETGKLEGYPCASCDQLNIEEESPLLYSNRDEGIGKTSSTKFNLEV